MKRVTCALQDTTAPRLHTTHRIHIPAWKRCSGMKMQITKLVSFMSGCEGSERRGGITIIQQDFNPKCSSNATSCSDLGLKREGKGRRSEDWSGKISKRIHKLLLPSSSLFIYLYLFIYLEVRTVKQKYKYLSRQLQ